MERLKPSEVRQRILDQHAVLREQLESLEQLVGKPAELAPIKAAAVKLHTDLSDHIQEEEALLIPELLAADGFGQARVDALRQEHVDQRATLQALIDSIVDSENATDVAARVQRLIARIRADMEEEEHTHLSPNVLKDDIITSDFIG